MRYERLVTDPAAATEKLAGALGVPAEAMATALGDAHTSSVGRWQRDLTPEQLADVDAEAGDLLAALGYRD